ncbi:MAG: hypothetical protein A3J38_03980 [Gammaproteobacteria bacterium RIFCSPHIGHO2_12_FULL_45_9]|nr:MAG: hypothetical protein A3J38_03980 [Gammaproteobacteria bacterium RIFCSPHIGHO2_12_FULL_45_9]
MPKLTFLSLRLLWRGVRYIAQHPVLCLYPLINTVIILTLAYLYIIPLHHQEALILHSPNAAANAAHTLWVVLLLLAGLALLANAMHLWTQLAMTHYLERHFQQKPISIWQSFPNTLRYLPSLWIAKVYHIGLYLRRAWSDEDDALAIACGTQQTFILTIFTYCAVLTGVNHPRQQLALIRERLEHTWGKHLFFSSHAMWFIGCIEVLIVVIMVMQLNFQQLFSTTNLHIVTVGIILIWFIRNIAGLHARLLRTALFYFATHQVAPPPFTAPDLQQTLKPHPFHPKKQPKNQP